MARRRRAQRSDDTMKYLLIGAVALVVLFLVFNVAPTGKYIDVPAECEWTSAGNVWTAAVPGFCSPDDDLRYETDCVGGVCSDTTYTTQADCEDAGTCSDTTYTTQADCEDAGTCSDPSHNNDESTCIGKGTCSDGTIDVDQTTCESAGTCSDTTYTTQADCEDAGTCSEIHPEDEICDDQAPTWTAETWTPDNIWTANTWTSDDNSWTGETWTDNEWTAAVPGYCSDGTSADQDSCEAVGTCDDGVSTTEAECIASELCTTQELEDADGDGIDDTEDAVWDLTQSGLTTDSEEVEVNTYSLSNDGTFSMDLQSSTSLSAGCNAQWGDEPIDQETCEAAKHTWSAEVLESCSDDTSEDQATCLESGSCSDEGEQEQPAHTTKDVCEADGVCSNSEGGEILDNSGTCITCEPNSLTEETCLELEDGTWSPHTWTSTNTWTPASEASCSDGTSTDQTTCEETSVNTWNEASDILTDLQSATALVKVDYYDLETNEVLSSTVYTSQVSVGETASEAFAISVPQTDIAVGYIATVNVWSGMIGTAEWQSYSEKIELRGEFHP